MINTPDPSGKPGEAQPQVILADEPTGNLDVDTADLVIDTLQTLAHQQQATVIIASHDTQIVAACDQVLALTTSTANGIDQH